MTILLWADAATIAGFVALVAALTVRDMARKLRRWIDGGEG